MEEKFKGALLLALPFVAGIALASGAVRWNTLRSMPLLKAEPGDLNIEAQGRHPVVSSDITLANLSDALVLVSRVETSCGCTTTSQLRSVAPHGTAPLSVRIDTSGKRGTFGEFVRVRFADEHRTPLLIPIQVTVDGDVAVEPQSKAPDDACVAPPKPRP